MTPTGGGPHVGPRSDDRQEDAMLETRFSLILSPDTDDADEAREDALDFIAMAKEGWYSSVRLDGEITVTDLPDDD